MICFVCVFLFFLFFFFCVFLLSVLVRAVARLFTQTCFQIGVVFLLVVPPLCFACFDVGRSYFVSPLGRLMDCVRQSVCGC